MNWLLNTIKLFISAISNVGSFILKMSFCSLMLAGAVLDIL